MPSLLMFDRYNKLLTSLEYSLTSTNSSSISAWNFVALFINVRLELQFNILNLSNIT